jgi:hypothetical protein|nr:MAG TPA: hypothetical protein [Caudoviricetes sp.]
MANRRMFSLDVIDTDKFMEMPLTAQALYFHLGMRADDDGFISSPRNIMKLVECKKDDMNVLIARGFVIPFDSGIMVISDWNVNNWIRPDRKRETIFKHERALLDLKEDVYVLNNGLQPFDNQMSTLCHTQDSIGKGSIGKVNNTICPEPKLQPTPSGLLIPLNDNTMYDIPQDKIAIWKDTYRAVDVEQELRKMIAWCYSNPTKRKTRRGVDRFINSWLSREQDRGSSRRQQQAVQEPGRDSYEAYHEMYQNLGPDSPDDPFQ